VGTVFQSDIIVFASDGRFAIGPDGEVFHIPGVVAVGIIETVLLAVGIEVSTGRFEVRSFALGDLMEVDGMFSGREIVQFELECDARSLIPDEDVADGFALSIFKFDFGLGRALGGEGSQREEQSERERGKGFHGFGASGQQNYNQFAGAGLSQLDLVGPGDGVGCPQRCGVYCEAVSEILAGKSAIMALNAVEQVAEQVPADDFQALEDKIYRTIEMFKAARQAQAVAERDAQRLRQQMQDREEELVGLRRETVRLKKEREEIRGRVEKMLEQIESIAEAS
jgi:hypothetical protein